MMNFRVASPNSRRRQRIANFPESRSRRIIPHRRSRARSSSSVGHIARIFRLSQQRAAYRAPGHPQPRHFRRTARSASRGRVARLPLALGATFVVAGKKATAHRRGNFFKPLRHALKTRRAAHRREFPSQAGYVSPSASLRAATDYAMVESPARSSQGGSFRPARCFLRSRPADRRRDREGSRRQWERCASREARSDLTPRDLTLPPPRKRTSQVLPAAARKLAA